MNAVRQLRISGDSAYDNAFPRMENDKLYLLDQTRLPGTYVYLEYSDYLKVADAIKILS